MARRSPSLLLPADEPDAVYCAACDGSGQGPTEWLACSVCQGRGEVLDDLADRRLAAAEDRAELEAAL